MNINEIDKKYQDLLVDIITNGKDKKDRTGTGTRSVFGRQIRHDMKDGFPLLTTKKMAVKTMMTELKWFLKGDTNIKYLVDNGCNIWNGDAYKNYEKYAMANSYGVDVFSMDEFIDEIKTNDEFAQKWGELGPIYGNQWKEWGSHYEYNNMTQIKSRRKPGIDQIQNLINDLKNNPDSRRLMVSAWNVGELDNMVLPPCHYGFQIYTRELNLDERIDYYNGSSDPLNRSSDYFDWHMDVYDVPKREISLMWNQRSVDTFLGLPFNIASYATLLMLLAEELNMVPGEIIGNLGDTHLYVNHLDQAQEQIDRDPHPYLPTLKLSNVDILNGEFDYEVLHYHSHPPIKAPLSN
jgi:thymidylate synthase